MLLTVAQTCSTNKLWHCARRRTTLLLPTLPCHLTNWMGQNRQSASTQIWRLTLTYRDRCKLLPFRSNPTWEVWLNYTSMCILNLTILPKGFTFIHCYIQQCIRGNRFPLYCFHVCTRMQSVSKAQQGMRPSFHSLFWCSRFGCTHFGAGHCRDKTIQSPTRY